MSQEERIKELKKQGMDLGSATRIVDYEDLIKDINELAISRKLTDVLKRIVEFSK